MATARRARSRIIVRDNDDGALDEVFADRAQVHLEQMDSGTWWLRVERGKEAVVVWLTSRGKIVGRAEQD